MTPKRSYKPINLILIVIIIAIAYLLKKPWLPISKETKISLEYPKDSLLNFTELTAQYGYLSEEHKTVTDDGYILTLFRIVKARKCDKTKKSPPVLLVHGLLQSSDSFIVSGPDAGIAYMISDACHDLWVGNIRGNHYSRSHIRLDPDKNPEYWNFDVDEIGRFDVPALIDYVLDYTEVKKLNYIGFSQGSGSFVVMCSERPEYCDKVGLVIGLAPASRHLNSKSTFLRALTQSVDKLQNVFYKFGIYEMLSTGGVIHEISAFFCGKEWSIMNTICSQFFNLIDNANEFHSGSITNETIRNLFGHFPAGTSVKNLARYGQSGRSGTFDKFDYGKEENLVVYGSENPPIYNISAVNVPLVCIYGQNDALVDVEDVQWFIAQLPNLVEAVKIENPLWNHLDVTYSQYTGITIFPKIKEYLSKYSL